MAENRKGRSSQRLQGWDYTAAGYYFVTICVRNRRPVFGQIDQANVSLNPLGSKADEFWRQIPTHHASVRLDVHIVMPNHLHGIVVLGGTDVGTLYTTSLHPSEAPDRPRDMGKISPAKGSLGNVIRTYKGAVTRWARSNGFRDFAWQPRYYDHIVRDDAALDTIRGYIRTNPLRWQEDRFYPHD